MPHSKKITTFAPENHHKKDCDMKKVLTILIGAALLMSSCGSYEATGAYTGGQFGNIIGSAIGGLSGGWRGHEVGSIIGTIGGAAAGAAIGHAADKAQERKYEERAVARRQQSAMNRRNSTYGQDSYDRGTQSQQDYDQSGYDPQMRGDDRISFSNEGDGSYGSYPTEQGNMRTLNIRNTRPALEVRNAGVYEDQRDGVLCRGEKCQVIFEIANNSEQTVYDVFPLVEEATGNKHVHISPNLRVESIDPHRAIRYTATLVADNGLKNGQIEVRVGVAQGNSVIHSQTKRFTIPTAKAVKR